MIINEKFIKVTHSNDIIINLYPLLDDVEIYLSSWKNGFNYMRKINGKWVYVDYDLGFPVITDTYLSKPGHPFQGYIHNIPSIIIKNTKSIQYLQYSIIRSAYLFREAFQLVQSNVVLLWLTVLYINNHEFPLSTIKHLLFQKRRLILKKILGVNGEKYVKFINKIIFIRGDKDEITLITRCVKSDNIVNGFRFYEKINIQSLYIVERYPLFIGYKLLNYYSAYSYDSIKSFLSPVKDIIPLIEDTINIGNQLGFKNIKSILQNIDHPKKLKKLHDRWSIYLSAKTELREEDMILPTHPAPGNDDIEPIRTVNEIIKEARAMNNCLVTYIERTLKEECYLYRVIRPERATLELKINSGKFVLSQIKLASNEEPSKFTKDHVYDWINNINKKYR